MKLSSADIKRLYGDKLFILPERERLIEDQKEEETPIVSKPSPEKVEEVSPPPIDLSLLKGNQRIIWKMKPAAKLALILHKAEFTNRELTSLLKNSILKAGIDPAWVGFGIIEKDGVALDLQDMSVQLALICDNFEGSLPSPVQVDEKKIWLSSKLALVANDPRMQEDLEASLEELEQEI